MTEHDAKQILDPDVYNYFATGSGIEETLPANVEAWRTLSLRPRVLRDVSSVDTATTVLGAPLRAPIAVSPTGYQRLGHAAGEVGTAKGTAEAGGLFTLSTRASATFDEVAAVAGPWWFQVYVLRDRELTAHIVRRAAETGARALVLTADTPYVANKARQTGFPAGFDAPSVVPELGEREDEGVWQNPAVTYDDIGWLHELSGLPIVVKGVLRADDAKACLEAGAQAIWVSNHGARQLDGAVPTARALPEVVDAVGTDCEVYVDGGIRTGRDVLRALALGAHAAFVGRPALWALAIGGSDGVRDALTGLREEFEEALALAGGTSLADIGRDLIS